MFRFLKSIAIVFSFCFAFCTSPLLAQGVFDLEVIVVGDGSDIIDFGTLRNLDEAGNYVAEPAYKQVRLVVHNATGKPYRITQFVNTRLTNEMGTAASEDTVYFRSEILRGEGMLRTTGRTRLRTGDEEIFVSNRDGDEAEILITYDVQLSDKAKAGFYNGLLTYRLNTT